MQNFESEYILHLKLHGLSLHCLQLEYDQPIEFIFRLPEKDVPCKLTMILILLTSSCA